MEYTLFDKKLLSGLRYKVFDCPEGKSILSKIPALKNLKSFKAAEERKDVDRIIRFIMLMYDKNSPYIRLFQDIETRKKECAHQAGYDLNKDEESLKSIFNFTDAGFSDMVIEFLKDQNSRVWAMVVSNEQTFYEFQKALLSEVTNFTTEKDKLSAISVKSKLMEDSDVISARLDGYYRLLFGDDKVSDLAQNSYTPEGMAKR